VWGANMTGQLGTGDDNYVWEPVRVMTGHVIKRVVAGLSHTLVLTDKGELYGWGVNKLNQLGMDKSVRQVMAPRHIPLTVLEDCEKIIDLASGLSHTLLCTDRGNAYTFGTNQYGQAGTGKLDSSVMPTRVLSGQGGIRHIACGNFNSFCVTQNNSVFVWGLGSDYQLCSGQKELVMKPTELTDPSFKDFDVLQIASGWSHTLARVRLKPNKTLEQVIGSRAEESE
jgi:alpha-tubulin suppressor-like RCC1 family protein